MKRAIEDYFPIVDINRLAIPERNAFKPIYQMHKWFARRASCVFRAILLGCLKPEGTDIMAEFYSDHNKDLDTKDKLILDPFMGGGTTVVEALRLGCKVIGIDLNPVAWFIVKTEVEPVDIELLKTAFERLANRLVEWSGKSVRETLLDQYKTECPCCGNGDANTIYLFWVRHAVCHNALCPGRAGDVGIEVPLFSNYIIAQKKPSIRFFRDVSCPHCAKTFDWEIEPAALVANPKLMAEDARTSAGELRGNVRWTYGGGDSVKCPWCQHEVEPGVSTANDSQVMQRRKKERKKVALNVLLCPNCESVWQWRGELAEEVACPLCSNRYDPRKGTLADAYDFVCSCGARDGILDSLRRLTPNERLRFKPYGIEGYCSWCAGNSENAEETSALFDEQRSRKVKRGDNARHSCLLTKNNGKFFKRITPADLALYQEASESWLKYKSELPYPQQEIPFGYQTVKGNDLPGHGFVYWHQLFNPRQLLCLASLLQAIGEEHDETLREMLLSGFYQLLRNQCMLCFYNPGRDELEPLFSRKDFAPPKTPCENSVWGTDYGRGTFTSVIDKIIAGKNFCLRPSDRRVIGLTADRKAILEDVPRNEVISGTIENARLEAVSATQLDRMSFENKCDFVVTDPPYADNVNYSEVSDFFYVWLRLSLADRYPVFAPELTPKAEEIIAQEVRGRSMADFEKGLTDVFKKSGEVLKDDGLLAFTFHHEKNEAWETVLEAVMNAGFAVEAAYPYESDARKSGSMGAQKIAYDIIHVCRKRNPNASVERRSWAGIRQEVRRRARDEIRAIENGRYGNDPLSPADVNIVLIGKCLELYSRHYGAVVDHLGNNVDLHEALKEIRSMVDDLVSKEHPLPNELEDIDAESRIYLLALSGASREIKSDDVHKATRGILEPDDLLKAGLIIKGRAKRGRTYEVKQPSQRFRELKEKFDLNGGVYQSTLFADGMPVTNGKVSFIDHVHFLIGLAEGGDDLRPWMERFRGLTPQIRAACEWMLGRNPSLDPALRKILGWLDPGSLFRPHVQN
jgi:putative DNA methylase